MPADFHNPISKAIRPEDTAEALSKYLRSQQRGREEYALMVQAFYDLITDFYEYGWGQSFHFAPGKEGASFEEALAGHQYYLGKAIGLKPGMKVLDIGCGVGGPQRSIARKFGAAIIGLNISEYQVGKCTTYNQERGPRADICSVLARRLSWIYRRKTRASTRPTISRRIAHAPDKTAAYAEVIPDFAARDDLRRLRLVHDPAVRRRQSGAPRNQAGCRIRQRPAADRFIRRHHRWPPRVPASKAIEARDRAPDADPGMPWYRPLEGSARSLKSLPRAPLGRKITSAVLRVLEGVRAVPKGSLAISEDTQRGGRQPRGRRAPRDLHAHVLPQGAQAGLTRILFAIAVCGNTRPPLRIDQCLGRTAPPYAFPLFFSTASTSADAITSPNCWMKVSSDARCSSSESAARQSDTMTVR